MMLELHERFPEYGFDVHKGYITEAHSSALDQHGPCPEHRTRFINVARAREAHAARTPPLPTPGAMDDDGRVLLPTDAPSSPSAPLLPAAGLVAATPSLVEHAR
jgi:ribonuclease HII